MPKVEIFWCPNWFILSVTLPRRMSITWPAPKCRPLACCTRYTVDSSMRAASVPSHTAGGARQLSQLPQGSEASPK